MLGPAFSLCFGQSCFASTFRVKCIAELEPLGPTVSFREDRLEAISTCVLPVCSRTQRCVDVSPFIIQLPCSLAFLGEQRTVSLHI